MLAGSAMYNGGPKGCALIKIRLSKKNISKKNNDFLIKKRNGEINKKVSNKKLIVQTLQQGFSQCIYAYI